MMVVGEKGGDGHFGFVIGLTGWQKEPEVGLRQAGSAVRSTHGLT
jgi:hypothetical protein